MVSLRPMSDIFLGQFRAVSGEPRRGAWLWAGARHFSGSAGLSVNCGAELPHIWQFCRQLAHPGQMLIIIRSNEERAIAARAGPRTVAGISCDARLDDGRGHWPRSADPRHFVPVPI